MRVVAGEARGRRLLAPDGVETRPTSDRVREAVFNALGSLDAVHDADALDLFAGSGALGIEALSRGARSAVFVDSDRRAVEAVHRNLAATGLTDASTVKAMEATAYLRTAASRPHLVLLDPPYSFTAWVDLLALVVPVVAPDAVVVIESDRPLDPGPAFEVLKQKRYGGTVVEIARVRPGEPAATSGAPA